MKDFNKIKNIKMCLLDKMLGLLTSTQVEICKVQQVNVAMLRQ